MICEGCGYEFDDALGRCVCPNCEGDDLPRKTGSQHIVSVSGGKDSAACYLLAIERGQPFRAVTADTGHEAPETYEWIRNLARNTGGPEVETVKADFSKQIIKRKNWIKEHWKADGIDEGRLASALEALQPTGVPFLDMCLWKGLFPSTRRRFCTEELKSKPFNEQVLEPALKNGPVISWRGERRDESKARSKLPKVQVVRGRSSPWVIWRPIVHWKVEDVFALHKRHGLKPNPLYLKGMSRVGCFPCIMSRKSELASLSRRYPEAFDKIREWELLVSDASRHGQATFFSADKTPQGASQAKLQDDGAQFPDANDISEWSRTSRGGKQYDLLGEIDASAACSSQYGLCE